MELTHRCLICKEEHTEQGQQTRSPWQLSVPGGYVICRRCCEAGKDVRRRESDVGVMKHSLTLQFSRILTEGEWREVAERARSLPHVQSMMANATLPDVAYMPVPRCETCAWWQKLPGTVADYGECRRLVDSSGLMHGSRAIAVADSGIFGHLRTFADFGCVQWKEKE